MSAKQLRMVQSYATSQALKALSAVNILGSARSTATETGGTVTVITEVAMTPGQHVTYNDLYTALHRADPDATITQNGRNGAVIRWSNR